MAWMTSVHANKETEAAMASARAWAASAKLLRHRYPASDPEDVRAVAELHREAARLHQRGPKAMVHTRAAEAALKKLDGPRNAAEALGGVAATPSRAGRESRWRRLGL